jgi:hypothetical protein
LLVVCVTMSVGVTSAATRLRKRIVHG